MSSDSSSSQCPPQLNTDVSGIGVRISFYLQALFLSLLSARSGSLDEITDSLYTLVATNMAMAVTSLILGFKKNPEISLQDGLIVFYLLAMSWVAVFFSLPSYNRFIKSDKVLKYLSVFQSYLIFAFALALLVKGKSFGSLPQCNQAAVIVIFRPFSAIKGGRVFGWICVSLTIAIYSFLTLSDYLPAAREEWIKLRNFLKISRSSTGMSEDKGDHSAAGSSSRLKRTAPDLEANQNRPRNTRISADAGPSVTGAGRPTLIPSEKHQKNTTPGKPRNLSKGEEYSLGIHGTLIIEISVILVLWTLAVMNTELLIRWNKFAENDQSQWQFGQVLPMFLIVLPLVNLVKAFKEHKLYRRTHRRKVHRNRKKRVQKAKEHLNVGPGRDNHAESFSDTRHPGSSHPFPNPGDGADPLQSLFGNLRQSQSHREDMQSARISIHSIHSRSSVSSGRSSGSDGSSSGPDRVQENNVEGEMKGN